MRYLYFVTLLYFGSCTLAVEPEPEPAPVGRWEGVIFSRTDGRVDSLSIDLNPNFRLLGRYTQNADGGTAAADRRTRTSPIDGDWSWIAPEVRLVFETTWGPAELHGRLAHAERLQADTLYLRWNTTPSRYALVRP